LLFLSSSKPCGFSSVLPGWKGAFFSKAGAKVLLFFDITKYFDKKNAEKAHFSHFSCIFGLKSVIFASYFSFL